MRNVRQLHKAQRFTVDIPDTYMFEAPAYIFDDMELETQDMPDAGTVEIESKLELLNGMRQEHLQEILLRKPSQNSSMHIISNGGFSFFTFVPVLLKFIGHADEFYGSSWTMNRSACTEMLHLFDQGKLKNLNVLTGIYFKRRESSVYAQLLNGIIDRKQKYKCFENHTKIVLMCNYNSNDYLVCEGSANFTSNPRAEQYIVTNSKVLYDFHKKWMDKILHG